MKRKIEESFEVEKNTRLYELLVRVYMSSTEDQNKIFKSKKYYRRVEHREKLFYRIHSIIRKINTKYDFGWDRWKIEKGGSNNLYDVMSGHRQKFTVRKTS